MKALTITQPWATLVAIGAKHFETRSWSTAYRGTLAIHAGKGLGPVGGMRGLRALCATEPFRSVLVDAEYADPADLPRGIIIAECELVGCFSTSPSVGAALHAARRLVGVEATPEEYDFGDYSPGRYAWALKRPELNYTPPIRGALGLWTPPCLSTNPHARTFCEKPNGHDGEHEAGARTWEWGDS